MSHIDVISEQSQTTELTWSEFLVFIALISNECCPVSPGVTIGLHVKISKIIGKILATQDLAK